MPHIPVVEILMFLAHMRRNRPFMRMALLLLLTLVTLSALSYGFEWIIPMDPASPACTRGIFPCYLGPPLRPVELVFQLGASPLTFLMPLIDLAAALLLLFRPSRAYLSVCLLYFAALFLGFATQPAVDMYTATGRGAWLHTFASAALFFLAIPPAIHEHFALRPYEDYDEVLPGYLQDAPAQGDDQHSAPPAWLR